MTAFQVSVVIPVYRAATYVRQAVESALAQPETAEVILVEDGSTDNSLEVCRALAAEYESVHCFQHADGGNHGAGMSRNLGIERSHCEYIAFLDADDYYLPDRFRIAREILTARPEIDGVYEATQDFYETNEIEEEHRAAGTLKVRLNMLTKVVAPEKLFEEMHTQAIGHFWIGSMTLRRTAFDRAGLFDTDLRVAQDKVIIRKLAATCLLAAGRFTEPVAMRRVHRNNRVTGVQRSPESVYKIRKADWQKMIEWGKTHLQQQQLVFLTLYLMTVTVRYLRTQRPILRFVPSAWISLVALPMLLRKEFPQYQGDAFVRRTAAILAFHSVYPPSLIRSLIMKLRRRQADRE